MKGTENQQKSDLLGGFGLILLLIIMSRSWSLVNLLVERERERGSGSGRESRQSLKKRELKSGIRRRGFQIWLASKVGAVNGKESRETWVFFWKIYSESFLQFALHAANGKWQMANGSSLSMWNRVHYFHVGPINYSRLPVFSGNWMSPCPRSSSHVRYKF